MQKSNMSRERKTKLKSLAKLMAKQSKKKLLITPELIECFNLVLSQAETDFLISMGTKQWSRDNLLAHSALTEAAFNELFENLLGKGLIYVRSDESGHELFSLQAIMIGWFEKYLAKGPLTPEKKEFGKRVNAYMKSFYRFNMFPLRGLANVQNRMAYTNQSIAAIPRSKKAKTVMMDVTLNIPDKQVYPAKDIDALIEKYGKDGRIAVMNCFCRRMRHSVNETCDFKQEDEICIGVGDHAEYIIRYGLGRRISKEEAINIIHETEKKGAVHTLMHYRDDTRLSEIEICNCCWDCCGFFGNYNRGILGLVFKSYYLAEMADPASCSGCGLCVKFCPVEAVSISEKKAIINKDRCIGCGQCAYQCPKDSLRLIPSERRVALPMVKKSKARVKISK